MAASLTDIDVLNNCESNSLGKTFNRLSRFEQELTKPLNPVHEHIPKNNGVVTVQCINIEKLKRS